jgi:hypothetical protein
MHKITSLPPQSALQREANQCWLLYVVMTFPGGDKASTHPWHGSAKGGSWSTFKS